MGDFSVKIDIDFYIPNFLDASIPMREIGNKCLNVIHQNIRQLRNADGTFYSKLSPKTIKDKQRLGITDVTTPLVRTGIFKRAIRIFRDSKNSFSIGVASRGNPRRDLLAIIHQEQGVNQHTRIARRPIGVSKKMLNFANARMEKWVSKQMKKTKHERIKI